MTVDFARFCADYDVAVTVHSRNRAAVLARYTDRLVHGYHLFHSGDGYDDHAYHCLERHHVPAGVVGLGATKNYVLRQTKERIVIMVDDDLFRIGWTHSPTYAWLDADGVHSMFMNLVVNALDLGAGVFGINENDIRKTSPLVPFRVRAMVGAIIGIVGRDVMFDERNRLKVDYDFCLQSIARNRLMLKDERYWLNQDRNTFAGGCMEYRTLAAEDAEVANLVAWWGADVIHYHDKRQTRGLSVNVPS